MNTLNTIQPNTGSCNIFFSIRPTSKSVHTNKNIAQSTGGLYPTEHVKIDKQVKLLSHGRN